MALHNQGTSQNPVPISFQQIKNEFGANNKNEFGAYRISDNIGSLNNLPLDNGIPQTGPIAFSDFYSKKLNIVVKCTGGTLDVASYGDGVVVGSQSGIIRSKPARNNTGWQGGKKIFINITGEYNSTDAKTSGEQSKRDWAFQTGNSSYWPSDTQMIIDLSSDAKVVGRGGDGGNHDKNGKNGSNGLRYLSGATLNFDPTVSEQTNGAYISAGGGGGGGGSFASQDDWLDDNEAEGGGGGGGNGLPAGEGGEGNGEGGDGNMKTGGEGRSGEDDAEAEGGNGGDGGSNGGDGADSSGGKNLEGEVGKGGEGGIRTENY